MQLTRAAPFPVRITEFVWMMGTSTHVTVQGLVTMATTVTYVST